MNLRSIQRGILALRGGSQPAASQWAATVGRIIQELENLNRSTERDFLAVGEKLRIFRGTARQIQSDMAAVTELISGDQGRQASHALSGMLKHSHAIDARIEQREQALTAVRELSLGLRRAFSGLSNLVAVFRSLCTLTRIETSRLGGSGADLGHLAAEIRPLSESIQASGEGVLESSGELERRVRSAIRYGAELRTTQLRQMPALIASVIESLRALEERRQLALQSSDRQTAEYAAVCEAIDDLVGSIQFHDITRQQVEHAVEALRHVRGGWKKGGREADSAPPDTRAILALQSSQLAEAARTFATSFEHIERDLESIGARVKNASETIQALLGLSGKEQDSFFAKLEGEFSAILHMLGASTAAEAEMDSTTSGLEETIARMRDSVAQIRATEIQIQRISINATIRAIHIGAAGVALNKIAEVMQRLALESNTNTEDVAGTLDAMRDAADGVSGGAADQTMTDQVIQEMRLSAGALHSSSESSVSRVNQVATLGARLAGDIGALRQSLSAGRLFATVVERAQRDLEAIGAQAGRASSAEPSDAVRTAQLEHFAKTYTMQSQRDVHEFVVSGLALPVAAAAPMSKAAKGDADLGENVDLF